MSFLGNQFRFGGQVNLTLSGSTRTLTIEEAFHRLIVFDSGTTDCTVTLPQIPGADWVIRNDTAHTVSVKNAVGSTHAISTGAIGVFYCDGDTGLFSSLESPIRIGGTTPGTGYFSSLIASALTMWTSISSPTDVYQVGATVTGTSTNATQFTLTTFAPSATNSASGVIEFVGGCRNVATGAVHIFRTNAAFKLVSGTATVGAAPNLLDAGLGTDEGALDAALATAAVAFDTSSGTIRVRATGVAATNLSWWGRLTVTAATVS